MRSTIPGTGAGRLATGLPGKASLLDLAVLILPVQG